MLTSKTCSQHWSPLDRSPQDVEEFGAQDLVEDHHKAGLLDSSKLQKLNPGLRHPGTASLEVRAPNAAQIRRNPWDVLYA